MKKFNKFNKFIALPVCIALAAIILLCSIAAVRFFNRNGSMSNAAKITDSGDPAAISWYIDSYHMPEGGQRQEQRQLENILAGTGLKPEITIPDKNKNEKFDLMIASNNLPDMITLNLEDVNISKLIRLKKLYPMDDLIRSHEPGFMKQLDAGLLRDTTYDDGKLYGLPGDYIPDSLLASGKNMGEYTYNVRKDIYIRLGSPDMSTPESFARALELFKTRYPVIEGKPSIPVSLFSGDMDQLTIVEASFGVKEFYADRNENLYIKFKDPGYTEIVRFLNNLYREGLLDPLAFIKKQQQLGEDVAAGRVFAMPGKYSSLKAMAQTGVGSENGTGNRFEYIAIEPMRAVPGAAFPGECRYGTTFTMVTSVSQKGDKAVRLIRVLWDMEEQENSGGKTLKSIFPAFPSMFYPLEYSRALLEPDSLAARKMADKYADTSNTYMKNMDPDYGLPIGLIKSKLEDIVQKDFPIAIMAESEDSANVIFRGMLQKMEQAGLKKLEHYWTERNKLNHSENKFK